MKKILAIDAGTTSVRAAVVDSALKILAVSQKSVRQTFPDNGWVEQNPAEIITKIFACCRDVMHQLSLSAQDIAAIGITNQRETTILWDKKTGEAIYPAIVWQDRRTANLCEEFKKGGHEQIISQKTGLLLDPYFSATKIAWILANVPKAKILLEDFSLAFGTVDSYLLWHLTKGKVHATDITNASRTLIFNIHEDRWDEQLLKLFAIPATILPEVKACDAHFGDCDPELFGAAIPITGIAGDQQAAAIGQVCFKPGMIKSTFGTGSFVILNTGEKLVVSKNRLLSTIAYKIGNQKHFALEGSVFNAGTVIEWLKDKLEIIEVAKETETTAKNLSDNDGVYFVPAFTGLGAPYWQANARGAIFGLTKNTGRAQIIRAALEAICYQTKDLLTAMSADYPEPIIRIRVDGGMVANNWLLQFLADMLNIAVERPKEIESTLMGAAILACLGSKIFTSLEEVTKRWHVEQTFTPTMPNEQRDSLYQRWLVAVNATIAMF